VVVVAVENKNFIVGKKYTFFGDLPPAGYAQHKKAASPKGKRLFKSSTIV